MVGSDSANAHQIHLCSALDFDRAIPQNFYEDFSIKFKSIDTRIDLLSGMVSCDLANAHQIHTCSALDFDRAIHQNFCQTERASSISWGRDFWIVGSLVCHINNKYLIFDLVLVSQSFVVLFCIMFYCLLCMEHFHAFPIDVNFLTKLDWIQMQAKPASTVLELHMHMLGWACQHCSFSWTQKLRHWVAPWEPAVGPLHDHICHWFFIVMCFNFMPHLCNLHSKWLPDSWQ